MLSRSSARTYIYILFIIKDNSTPSEQQLAVMCVKAFNLWWSKRLSFMWKTQPSQSRVFFKLWLATTFSASINSYFTHGWSIRNTNTSVFIRYLPLNDFLPIFWVADIWKASCTISQPAKADVISTLWMTSCKFSHIFFLWLFSQVTLSATDIMSNNHLDLSPRTFFLIENSITHTHKHTLVSPVQIAHVNTIQTLTWKEIFGHCKLF